MHTSNEISEMDGYALENIKRRVGELIARNGFARDDREDLEQQLFLQYWKRIGRFNPERGTYKTFIDRMIRNRASSLALNAQRLGARRVMSSLSSADESGFGMDIPAEPGGAWLGPTPQDIEMEIDAEKVLASLDPRLRLLAERTDAMAIPEIGAELGISLRRTYQLLRELRAAFQAAGLVPALEGSR